MTIAITTQVSEMPEELPPSDFGFDIDYEKGEGPAKRVFGATYRFIEACESCSQALIGSIGVEIEPVVVLEDIEASSLKSRFKFFWTEEGEGVVKSGDVKRILSTFLVEGIKAIVRETNDQKSQPEVLALQDQLLELSESMDRLNLASRVPIPADDLIVIIKQFESIKDLLVPGDRADLVLPGDKKVRVDQSVVVDIDQLRAEATREILVHRDPSMILIVKKPDYLADSQWGFRYDGRNFLATIEDKEWLDQFQQRQKDVRPGDALKCEVRIEVSYGYDNEVISKRYFVEKIISVIVGGVKASRQIVLEFSEG